jgi:hypothetical protein
LACADAWEAQHAAKTAAAASTTRRRTGPIAEGLQRVTPPSAPAAALSTSGKQERGSTAGPRPKTGAAHADGGPASLNHGYEGNQALTKGGITSLRKSITLLAAAAALVVTALGLAVGDTNGESVNAFGGSWYALSPAGDEVAPPANSGNGGYGY